MVAGRARELQARDPRPVSVLGLDDRPRWHAIWENNPRIARPGDVARGLDAQTLKDCPRHRPYLEYQRILALGRRNLQGKAADYKTMLKAAGRWFYTDWKAPRGEIHLSEAETEWAARHGDELIVIEPHIKPGTGANGDWGWDRWQSLVDSRPDWPWVQLGPEGTRILGGVRHIATPSFRLACALLEHAAAAVLPEGGLHHAAAALRVPAVVIFGGMRSPANTGYGDHVNLYEPHEDGPCGRWTPCDGCARSMAAIKPEIVAYHLEQMSR